MTIFRTICLQGQCHGGLRCFDQNCTMCLCSNINTLLVKFSNYVCNGNAVLRRRGITIRKHSTKLFKPKLLKDRVVGNRQEVTFE